MISLLIVDDAAGIRELLGDALEKKGVKVFRAATGVQALKLFKDNNPNFVFLDIKLPDLNGMNVFECMKEINPKTKIYFVTGKDNQMYRDKASELKAAGYLEKPVKLGDLLAILGITPV